jgi:hypothetical protein
MSERSLTISYQNRSTVDDPYWLRMQVHEDEPNTVTVGEAADIIDELYSTSPCDDEPTPEEIEEPTGSVWDKAFDKTKLVSCDNLDAMDTDPGAYDVKIRVYRSHQDEVYKLVLSNGIAQRPIRVEDQEVEILEVEDSYSVTLKSPVYKNFKAVWTDIDGPRIKRNGNTLSWSVKTTGTLRVEYGTIYDLVDIHVTGQHTDQSALFGTVDPWMGTGWYSGSEVDDQLDSIQDTECQVLAFYHYQYESLTLTKPETDSSISSTDLEEICQYAGTVHRGDSNGFGDGRYDVDDCKEACGDDETCKKDCEKVCYKTIKYTTVCKCGGHESDTRTQVPVQCPPGYNTGSDVDGGAEEYGGTKYIDCGVDEVSDKQFYEDRCCEPWSFRNADGSERDLPECYELYEPFPALRDIDKDSLVEEYGENINIIAVGPVEDRCGDIVTEQNVPKKQCCDEIEPITWDYDNSAVAITPGSSGIVFVKGGKGPYTWKVRGDGFYLDDKYTIRDGVTSTGQLRIYLDTGSCGPCSVYVADGCSSVSESVRSTAGEWVKVFDSSVDSGGGYHHASLWIKEYDYRKYILGLPNPPEGNSCRQSALCNQWVETKTWRSNGRYNTGRTTANAMRCAGEDSRFMMQAFNPSCFEYYGSVPYNYHTQDHIREPGFGPIPDPAPAKKPTNYNCPAYCDYWHYFPGARWEVWEWRCV